MMPRRYGEVEETLVIRARRFTPEEIRVIQRLAAERPDLSRRALSREVCRLLDWRQANGRLKDRSCRDVLTRLEALGLLRLPPRRPTAPANSRPEITPRTAPGPPITASAGQLGEISVEIVTGGRRQRQRLWNEYVERYHFLGSRCVVGPQLKYFLRCEQGQLACAAFGGAAWKIGCRDTWIGWSPAQRRQGLPWIVNNVRFLIFPWVQSRELASRMLGLLARRIADDWQQYYAYRPVLLETFVDSDRHDGACYKAANWILLGRTAGRGKCDRYYEPNRSRKFVFVYPLHRKARSILLNPPNHI